MTAAAGAGVWDPRRSHIRVMLRDVETEVSIGLHPWERHPERPSRVIVNVEMFAELPEAGSAEVIDYDPIRDRLRRWKTRPHTPLLETLIGELVDLCFENARVEACRVSVVKPDIFNEAAAAGVEAFVCRADHVPARRQ
jgi:dihydroneopterin aldolase